MLVALSLFGTGCLLGPGRPARGQASLAHPAFDEVRRAADTWNQRSGPERQVVDVVCLVPDAATFLEAISQWDERHFFPILIDDVEYTFKFLRAFRPARVVRYPGKARALAPDVVWDRAVAAVGRAWGPDGATEPLRGDVVPKTLGPTPPGLVVSYPGSPALAGAVALAAGRFQPLLRWEAAKKSADDLTLDEAGLHDRQLTGVIAACVPDHDKLGDGCDFVTLAGDYPYRYIENGKVSAFDDLILRAPASRSRWGYAGRLLGGPVVSVYRAMCSLFLTPETAVAYNTYAEGDRPWSDYAMTSAAARLDHVLPTRHIHGDRANLAGWHSNFDPVNRQGLALINTHGSPMSFYLPAGPGGHTSDIAESAPTAVLMIHSFSAESPENPDTLAGRWLSNGAFVYFGAMNEPFLQSFRTPSLVSSFLAENVPVVVAVRMTSTELYARPWRLVFFGDPLWRIKKPASAGPRLADWEAVAAWPVYGEFRQPEPEAPESTRLTWALKTAIFRLQAGATARPGVDIAAVLLGIDRNRLDPRLQPFYDDLLVDTLLSLSRVAELLDRLTRIPPASRTRDIRRHLETAQTAALQRALAAKDFRQSLALWSDVIRAPASGDFVQVFTQRVASLADTPVKQGDWLERLRAARRAAAEPANTPVIEVEIKRISELLSNTKGR